VELSTKGIASYFYDKNMVYDVEVFIDKMTVTHSRRVYGLFDTIGDYGGVASVLF
jgi:hypothetical protein